MMSAENIAKPAVPDEAMTRRADYQLRRYRFAFAVGIVFACLVAGAFAAAARDAVPVCFDREIVFAAMQRLSLKASWSGKETGLDPVASAIVVPEYTHVLFLEDGVGKSDRWSLWKFKGDEGCRVSRGVDSQRLEDRLLLRGLEK